MDRGRLTGESSLSDVCNLYKYLLLQNRGDTRNEITLTPYALMKNFLFGLEKFAIVVSKSECEKFDCFARYEN